MKTNFLRTLVALAGLALAATAAPAAPVLIGNKNVAAE